MGDLNEIAKKIRERRNNCNSFKLLDICTPDISEHCLDVFIKGFWSGLKWHKKISKKQKI